MENILKKLPKVHACRLDLLLNNIHEAKDKETQLRVSCYYRGYVACLRNQNLIDDDEFFYLSHHSVFED